MSPNSKLRRRNPPIHQRKEQGDALDKIRAALTVEMKLRSNPIDHEKADIKSSSTQFPL